MSEPVAPRFGDDGLVTAVVQDATSSEVLMVAHMNRAAWDATLRTRRATFFSRSRQRLWEKGETSGNTMHVREIRIDCDGDAVLLRVDADRAGVPHRRALLLLHRGWTGARRLTLIPLALGSRRVQVGDRLILPGWRLPQTTLLAVGESNAPLVSAPRFSAAPFGIPPFGG